MLFNGIVPAAWLLRSTDNVGCGYCSNEEMMMILHPLLMTLFWLLSHHQQPRHVLSDASRRDEESRPGIRMCVEKVCYKKVGTRCGGSMLYSRVGSVGSVEGSICTSRPRGVHRGTLYIHAARTKVFNKYNKGGPYIRLSRGGSPVCRRRI